MTYKQTGHGWESMVEVDGKLITQVEAIRGVLGKFKSIRYEPCGNNYKVMMRDPTVDPTEEEAANTIIRIME